MKKVFYLDMAEISDRSAFQDLLRRELSLPEYYGSNLDALYDVLTEYALEWDIIFYNCRKFDEAESLYFKQISKMARQAMKDAEHLRIRFYP